MTMAEKLNIFQVSIVGGAEYLMEKNLFSGSSDVEFVWEVLRPFLKMYGIKGPENPLEINSYIGCFERVENPLPGDIIISGSNDNRVIGIASDDPYRMMFYSKFDGTALIKNLRELRYPELTILRMWQKEGIPDFNPDELNDWSNLTFEGEFCLPGYVLDKEGNISGKKKTFIKVFANEGKYKINPVRTEMIE